MGNDRGNEYLPDLDGVPPKRLAALPGPVPVLARQSDRRSCEHRLSAPRARARRPLRLRGRLRRVLQRDLPRRSAARRPVCCRRRSPAGHNGFERCVVFHSLSKRSSVPGLRSGFVAGDAQLIQSFLLYRTYHGCAMPLPTQLASIAAWNDDRHVVENRRLYREKFATVLPILREVLEVDAPRGKLLPVAESRRRRTLRARAVRAPARDSAAGQLHRARHSARQSWPRPRPHFARRDRARMHRRGASVFAISCTVGAGQPGRS